MTSKERILGAVKRTPIDRVPISMYELSPVEGSAYASFANKEPSYQRLLKLMSEKTDTIMQIDAAVTYPEIDRLTEVLEQREGDAVLKTVTIHTPKGDLVSRTREDDNIFTVWTLEHFLKEPDDIEKYMSLDFTASVDVSPVLEKQKILGDSGIPCPSVSDPICRAAQLFSMEDFLVFAITETDRSIQFLDFLWELTRYELSEMLVPDVTDIMFRIVGPEYATPPYLPDRYYEPFVTKYLDRMAKMINDAGAISRVHSHGKVRYALSEFAKTGVLCVDPVEPVPDGDISLSEIKSLYKDRFVLLGNIELKALETASPEEIEHMVENVLQDGMPGGGFILMPTATPINIPLSQKTEENMIAMIEAAHKFGQY